MTECCFVAPRAVRSVVIAAAVPTTARFIEKKLVVVVSLYKYCLVCCTRAITHSSGYPSFASSCCNDDATAALVWFIGSFS